jgi:hypothetical protein
MTFWGIDLNGKGLFVPMVVFAIWFKKCPCKILKAMDQVLNIFIFSNCNFDNIIF